MTMYEFHERFNLPLIDDVPLDEELSWPLIVCLLVCGKIAYFVGYIRGGGR